MLLEFRVSNFRSFAREASFSLLASGDDHLLASNTRPTGLRALPRALASAVIYGANASGKSNLLAALQYMRGVVMESAALKPEQAYNVQPFRLDDATAGAPTLFETTILLDGVRYQYGFEMTTRRIMAEWLLVYKTHRPQTWFDRRYDPATDTETFEFSSHFAGQKKVWQDSTRPNALFLSIAVQLNSEQLLPLHHWFAEQLVVLPNGGSISHAFTTRLIREDEGRHAVLSMLSAADIAIADVRTVHTKSMQRMIKFDLKEESAEAEEAKEVEVLEPRFRHQGAISAEFTLADESQGTQKLFALAGPLLDIMKEGKLLVIDELDRSLHPLLVRQIVETFQNPDLNRKGAQLVFTTHDTSLLDNTLLRRDQIWLTEKGVDQASRLIPLTEFSPRKSEALERGYLTGRYGGIPILESRLIEGTASRG
jgi:AAA15 family ATPase/GTPase